MKKVNIRKPEPPENPTIWWVLTGITAVAFVWVLFKILGIL
jgi:hypothetical protein